MFIPERIMLTGATGTGKSFAWLTLAEVFDENQFYCIDTDASVERMMTKRFRLLKNVHVYMAADWTACRDALKEIMPLLKPHDWIIVDQVCSVWDFVQRYFVHEIFQEDIGSYFMKARLAMKADDKKLDALDGWVDWSVINKLYQDWAHNLFYVTSDFKHQVNVLVTAKTTNINKKESEEIRDTFNAYGVKPEGEKRNVFRVHTVLLMQADRSEWFMTTIKDRERTRFERTMVRNFGLQYASLIEES